MNLRSLGTPPNAWSVDATTADLTRPPLQMKAIALATTTKMLRLDLAKAALIIIDMQNDFCHPDGWLAHIGVDVSTCPCAHCTAPAASVYSPPSPPDRLGQLGQSSRLTQYQRC